MSAETTEEKLTVTQDGHYRELWFGGVRYSSGNNCHSDDLLLWGHRNATALWRACTGVLDGQQTTAVDASRAYLHARAMQAMQEEIESRNCRRAANFFDSLYR